MNAVALLTLVSGLQEQVMLLQERNILLERALQDMAEHTGDTSTDASDAADPGVRSRTAGDIGHSAAAGAAAGGGGKSR